MVCLLWYALKLCGVSSLKHVHEFGPHNEVTLYRCIIYQQNHTDEALGFKQSMADVSAINFLRPRELNHRQFNAFLDNIRSECDDSVPLWNSLA